MKLSISRSAAMAAAFTAIVTRILLALAVENGPIHNGVWISTLLGTLLAMPYLACLDGMRVARSFKGGLRKEMMALLLVATAMDASVIISTIIHSADYLSPDHFGTASLVIPVALATLACIWRNGDTIGFGSMLWMRIFPAFMLVVILLQIRHYRPGWLFPVLGYGWRSILSGSIRTAGLFVTASATLLICDSPADSQLHPDERFHLWTWVASGMTAALLLVLRLMMAPTGLHSQSWLQRLDAMITNGRAPLYLQLPMIVLWVIGLMHLLACECFAASALLQRLMPRIDGRLCALMIVIACSLGAFSGFSLPNHTRPSVAWVFIAASVLAALSTIQLIHSGRDKPEC